MKSYLSNEKWNPFKKKGSYSLICQQEWYSAKKCVFLFKIINHGLFI